MYQKIELLTNKGLTKCVWLKRRGNMRGGGKVGLHQIKRIGIWGLGLKEHRRGVQGTAAENKQIQEKGVERRGERNGIWHSW